MLRHFLSFFCVLGVHFGWFNPKDKKQGSAGWLSPVFRGHNKTLHRT